MSHSSCPTCGQTHHSGDVCAARVLAELTRTPLASDIRHAADPDANALSDARLEPGDRLGPYLIERLIGRGGMGEVYEAMHVDLQRRVALKVLTRPLRRPLDRERFLAEGRMAAAFTHPNSVYVFETRDIGGMPTIAMELLPGDTLQDRIRRDGPMSPRQAVDVILQVIAGLHAADDAGVLHRDVKPANCLVDRDGTIKIGDFGLSISPGHAGMSPSSVAGTPHFAAPEQLRGDRLDRRSDIYAVGATLAFLLTGRPPFEADSLRQLEECIDAGRADLHAPEPMPSELRRIIRRCLAPRPDARHQGYAELRAALVPFATQRRPQSTGVARVTETAFELFALLPLYAFVILLLVTPAGQTPGPVGATVAAFVGLSAMWSMFKGHRSRRLWDRPPAAAGEWSDLVALGWPRPLLRAFVIGGLFLVGPVNVFVLKRFPAVPTLVPSVAFLGVLGLAYVAAIRREGSYQRFLDALSAKPLDDLPPAPTPTVSSTPVVTDESVGPYQIVGALDCSGDRQLLTAWDPDLHRHVWILKSSPGTQPASADVRGAVRISRLRWLQGHRSDETAWDAFEAPDGEALLAAVGKERWSTAVIWLLDLAAELRARTPETTAHSPLRLDHIWITKRGRGLLLDFQAPSFEPLRHDALATSLTPQQLLYEAAALALSKDAYPLPFSATQCLERLRESGYATLEDATTALRRTYPTADRIDRNVRMFTLSLSLLCALLVSLVIGEFVRGALSVLDARVGQAVTPLAAGLCATALLAVAVAAATKSGFWLSGLRMAVVTRNGCEASHARAALRGALAWSWVPLHVASLLLGGSQWLVPLLAAVAAGMAIITPARGIHDRLAGTYLVPR